MYFVSIYNIYLQFDYYVVLSPYSSNILSKFKCNSSFCFESSTRLWDKCLSVSKWIVAWGISIYIFFPSHRVSLVRMSYWYSKSIKQLTSSYIAPHASSYQSTFLFKEESPLLHKYSNYFLFKLYFPLSYWLGVLTLQVIPPQPHLKLWTTITKSEFTDFDHHLVPKQNIDVVCENQLLIFAISMI